MIDRERFEAYSRAIDTCAGLTKTALVRLVGDIRKLGREPTESELAVAFRAMTKRYGDLAAQAAMEFYKDVRSGFDGLAPYEPEALGDAATPEGAAAAARQALASNDAQAAISSTAAKAVRQHAADGVVSWAQRDPARPRCARIAKPTACAFCRLLAANGFFYVSEETALNAQLHSNCGCTIAVDFSADPALEGYSNREFVQQYEAARDSLGGATDRASVIAAMDKAAGRDHNGAGYYERITKPKREAAKAAQ